LDIAVLPLPVGVCPAESSQLRRTIAVINDAHLVDASAEWSLRPYPAYPKQPEVVTMTEATLR